MTNKLWLRKKCDMTTRECKACNKSISKPHWSKHIKTKSHIRNAEGFDKDLVENLKTYKCSECDKEFLHSQSLSRHKK